MLAASKHPSKGNKNSDKVQKAGITMPDAVAQTLSEVMTKLETWAAASRNTVNSHESTREFWKQEDADLPGLAKLPFESGDLKAGLKQAAELVDTLKKLLPTKEPKAKARQRVRPSPRTVTAVQMVKTSQSAVAPKVPEKAPGSSRPSDTVLLNTVQTSFFAVGPVCPTCSMVSRTSRGDTVPARRI